ncbi:PH domain-containing protein [Halobacterium litoreum]|uniref:PH domain-containing protein n=1 Tax=Halobacterium litoreum TaxID=2039234 RepID=A0ABD5NBP5_9EURY|nr:PH domain-containing protein [Halobacterium litoreum]UHH14591.1 PH domain-containing protein [Halobacterium litoreum]
MKLHPLSVPFRAVSRGIGLAWAFLVGGVALAQGDPVLTSGAVVLAVLAIAAIVAYEIAYYRRFEYELTEDSLDISSGVFSRREREIPLRRVQNVDVTRSFVARLLGLAKVDVETAGGGGTEASLRFVSREEAGRLQEEVRERRRATRDEATDAEESDATAEDTEERAERERRGETLFELSDRDLVLYGFLSFDPRLLSGIAALAPFVAPAVVDRVNLSGFGLAVVGAVLAVGALGIWVVSAVARIVQFYGFRLRRVGDDLRYERGLFERRDGTIPLSKLQTVSVEENVLMRRYGFASLAVETAGYAPGSSPSGGSEAAVPIAPREDVLALAQSLEPFDDFDVSRPPERARKRYVRRYALVGVAVLAVAFLVSRYLLAFPWYAVALLIPLAVPAARLAYRNRGLDLGGDHVVTQSGFWRRQTRVVPYRRVQTVIRQQTVFQKRWNLTTVVFDTAGSRSIAGGDAAAIDRDDADADEVATTVEERVLEAIGGSDSKTVGQSGVSENESPK